MYDLSFASQAAQAKMQINDALGIGPTDSSLGALGVVGQTAQPSPAAQGALPSPFAANAPAPPHPMQGMSSLAALQVGNPALSPGPNMPPPGGPLMARPQQSSIGPISGMNAMSQSKGPLFQVNPSQQAPGQQAAPKLFAKGGYVTFAVKTPHPNKKV